MEEALDLSSDRILNELMNPIKGRFVGKNILNIKCVVRFSLQILSEMFLIVKVTVRGMIINVYWSSCKVPLLLSDLYGT